MSWAAILALGAAAYALKAAGPLALGRRRLPAGVLEVLELLSIPLLAGLVAVQTFGGAGRLGWMRGCRRWQWRRCWCGGGRRSRWY